LYCTNDDFSLAGEGELWSLVSDVVCSPLVADGDGLLLTSWSGTDAEVGTANVGRTLCAGDGLKGGVLEDVNGVIGDELDTVEVDAVVVVVVNDDDDDDDGDVFVVVADVVVVVDDDDDEDDDKDDDVEDGDVVVVVVVVVVDDDDDGDDDDADDNIDDVMVDDDVDCAVIDVDPSAEPDEVDVLTTGSSKHINSK